MSLLAAGVVASLLAACSPGGGPEGASPSASPSVPSAPATSAPEPSTSPSPTPAPPTDGPLLLPPCDALLTLADAQAFYGPAAEAITPPAASAVDVMQGPVAAATVAEATQTRVCTWGIPNSDGGFNAVAAEIPLSSAANLIDALRNAGSFSESEVGGVTLFSRSLDAEVGGFAVAYAFFDTAWVTAAGALSTEGAQIIVEKIMGSVRDANPRLA